MPVFSASPLVAQLEENLFSALENMLARVDTTHLPLIDLSSGSPRQPTATALVSTLQIAAARPENHDYPSFWGKPAVRQAIADFYQRQYGVLLDPESEIAIFQGAHIGVTGLPRALLSPGQYLISTDPCYPLYRSAAAQAQAQFYGIPLEAGRQFQPDFSQVPENVARQGGLLMLNYPHNPTGAVASPALFEQALDFAQRWQMPLVHDFAYAAIGCDTEDIPPSLLAQPRAKEWGVEIYTLSKTFLMAGWRFGFAVGNASIINAFKKLHTHSYSTVFGAVQDAAVHALNLPDTEIRDFTAVYHRRRIWVLEMLQRMHWRADSRQGTFFLWLPTPPGYTSRQLTERLLLDAHVLVAPGQGFGACGEHFIRLSLTADDEALSTGLARIAALKLFG
ncbi:aminotransferase class I/II-fold pyridoxal phosphate-dependent enzyme [Citrobacter sp. JGM124]|uniref:aminotransferase class I/II-fold pyridoxal phosphate-dependent enzyme n=1 Tax=Citrobacter sp. JGM124 TaxID=2799789 RepID=UPI001BAD7FFE|nr:aminotransferase class I/II-fold pyridoxal phosphate-dependent enzyme [Citrobacter sp. JGM124]MBS0848195.1 aminotransferase class I/II-fold pyridoxal phosphate-dependent enzyme [Citrobacter sp. JGM124]